MCRQAGKGEKGDRWLAPPPPFPSVRRPLTAAATAVPGLALASLSLFPRSRPETGVGKRRSGGQGKEQGESYGGRLSLALPGRGGNALFFVLVLLVRAEGGREGRGAAGGLAARRFSRRLGRRRPRMYPAAAARDVDERQRRAAVALCPGRPQPHDRGRGKKGGWARPPYRSTHTATERWRKESADAAVAATPPPPPPPDGGASSSSRSAGSTGGRAAAAARSGDSVGGGGGWGGVAPTILGLPQRRVCREEAGAGEGRCDGGKVRGRGKWKRALHPVALTSAGRVVM